MLTQIKQVGGSEFNGAQGKMLYVLWEYQKLPIAGVSNLEENEEHNRRKVK